MKRLIGILGALMIIGSGEPRPGHAQRLHAGVKGGQAISAVQLDYGDGFVVISDGSRKAVVGGLFLGWELDDRLELRVEAVALDKGYTAANPSLEITYLEVPLLLRFGGAERLAPVVFAGFAPAYRIDCDIAYQTVEGPRSDGCEEVSPFGRSEATRSFDFGVTGGAGLVARVRGVRLELDVRYGHGLVDIAEAAKRSRNRTVALTVGVAMRIR